MFDSNNPQGQKRRNNEKKATEANIQEKCAMSYLRQSFM